MLERTGEPQGSLIATTIELSIVGICDARLAGRWTKSRLGKTSVVRYSQFPSSRRREVHSLVHTPPEIAPPMAEPTEHDVMKSAVVEAISERRVISIKYKVGLR